jgi:TolB protein
MSFHLLVVLNLISQPDPTPLPIPVVDLYRLGIRQNVKYVKISPDKKMFIFAGVDSAKNELLPRKPSGSIVYSDSLDDIYIYHIPNDSLVQLTNNQYCDKNPTWSPNGECIAFSSNRTGNFEIFIMDRHGNNIRQLTNNPAEDAYPELSPEGDRIAFTSERSGDGDPQIWIMNADGTNIQQLTDIKQGAYGLLSWSPAE